MRKAPRPIWIDSKVNYAFNFNYYYYLKNHFVLCGSVCVCVRALESLTIANVTENEKKKTKNVNFGRVTDWRVHETHQKLIWVFVTRTFVVCHPIWIECNRNEQRRDGTSDLNWHQFDVVSLFANGGIEEADDEGGRANLQNGNVNVNWIYGLFVWFAPLYGSRLSQT